MPKEQEKPSQYAIWYMGSVMEHTGYIATLEEAKRFTRSRFTSDSHSELTIQKCYPVREETKHPII